MKRFITAATIGGLLAGCSSIGIGVGIPIGRHGGISVGGSIPLPQPSRTAPPAPAASAASQPLR
jgi:hypothetical protein